MEWANDGALHGYAHSNLACNPFLLYDWLPLPRRAKTPSCFKKICLLDVFVHISVNPPPSPSPPFFFHLDWRYKRRFALTLFQLVGESSTHDSRKC